jgi:5-methylcytosine-specific restriction endonuclease McrA
MKEMNRAPDLRVHLTNLRDQRRQGKRTSVRQARLALTAVQRHQILGKTAGRCHIRGGSVEGDKWQADHVMAHSAGGGHRENNYLPAHSLCNNYRWDYTPDEFQYILKLGVWARTQVERGTIVGNDISIAFTEHEARRLARRKTPAAQRQ